MSSSSAESRGGAERFDLSAFANQPQNEGRAVAATAVPHLRRVLSLWDLIIYGIVSVTPSAPVTVFGLALVMSRGHAVDTILIAMVAMLLTAFSYGRMAAVYPSAGSAYAYVGRGLNPHLGFLAGWVMLLDYLVIPIFCTIYAALTMQRLIPEVPYVVWVAVFISVITYLNLRGIRATARTNQILLVIMGSVLVAFVVLAACYLFRQHGWSGLFSSLPFYNPRTFDFQSLRTATTMAATLMAKARPSKASKSVTSSSEVLRVKLLPAMDNSRMLKACFAPRAPSSQGRGHWIRSRRRTGGAAGSLMDKTRDDPVLPHISILNSTQESSDVRRHQYLCGFECNVYAPEVHSQWVRNKTSHSSYRSMLP